MFLQRSARALRHQWRIHDGIKLVAAHAASRRYPSRGFHSSQHLQAVKPVLLADIGEGIVECEIIQWFVEPEARVEEFSPLCEVQSDKASVEITSRFAGVVKRLHYDAGEMAKVGKPFIDIDIQGSVEAAGDSEALGPSGSQLEPSEATSQPSPPPQLSPQQNTVPERTPGHPDDGAAQAPQPKGKCATLATPAVRHLSKELDVDISQIHGSGKDGRVLKEDIYRYVQGDKDKDSSPGTAADQKEARPQEETPVPLSKTQEHMFKSMTRSLSIPHFLYADEIDFTRLVELRGRLNKVLSSSSPSPGDVTKLSYLPFIIKAVSLALHKYPILNARVDVDAATSKPRLVHRSRHDVGVAMDTPAGLLVPVVRDVASLSVLSIAAELARLQSRAAAGRLSPQDLAGGTVTVSNIGSIGGTYLSPVIVEREVAILGVGRMRTVPALDEHDRVVRRQVCNFSWSADHRVVDGATMARAAEIVRGVVEEPDVMVMHLR